MRQFKVGTALLVRQNGVRRRQAPIGRKYFTALPFRVIRVSFRSPGVLSFSGGAPLRGDPRLIAVIPVGMKAEELSSEIVSQNIMSIPKF